MQLAPVSSLQGLQRAGDRLERAAATIAAPQAETPRGSDPSPAPPSGSQGLTEAQSSGDVESALVDVVQARRAYEANAKALQQQDALARTAIGISA